MEPTTPLNPEPVATMPQPERSNGLLIGAGVVLTIALLGGLYYWMQGTKDARAPGTASAESWQAPTSDSDDAATIQSELEATNMNAFESQTNADVDASIQSI